MRFLLLVFFISFSAMATDWSDLQLYKKYKISQDFQLPQSERSGSLLDIVKGEEVVLSEIIPLSIPRYPMLLYVFFYKNCPGYQLKTEMEIIPIQGTQAKAGVFLENCDLNVYIEVKDYYSKSLFE